MYRPITGNYMNEKAFYAIGYFVPELIPSFVEFYVIRTIKQQDREQSQFISTLYQEEEDLREGVPSLPLDTFSNDSNTPGSNPSSPSLHSLPKNEKSPLLTQ